MARTHTFKGTNANHYAYIENGRLVIGEDYGREGGVIYAGTYDSCPAGILNRLHREDTRLYNSIVQYYDKTTNYQFADSRDLHGNGWYGWIEDGKLVIGHEAPREGGILFRGTYTEAAERGWLVTLLKEDQRLYHDIELYFTKHGVSDESDKRATHSTGDERCAAFGCCSEGDPRCKAVGYYCDPTKKTNEDFKKYGFDEETKTILFKVKLHKKNRVVHKVLVRGRFQADVIKKLMPPIPEVLTLQTPNGDVFAIRSDEISVVEFVDDFSNGITFTEG